MLPRVPLVVAGIAAYLLTAPAAGAADPECDIIVPAADRLEQAFNRIQPGTTAPPGVEGAIVNAARPLFGLTSPAAVDLRLWSSTLAAEVNRVDPYRPAGPDRNPTKSRSRPCTGCGISTVNW